MTCEKCQGIGLVPTATGSIECDCQTQARTAARLKRAHIPRGFENSSFFNFQKTAETARAIGTAWKFCEEFIPGNCGRIRGLLFSGSVGAGKTHLAVATLRQLIGSKGIDGYFVDVHELLDRLRSSYDTDNSDTQAGILRPIMTADLVVIDELGAERPTDWSFETLELVIGGLYNKTVPVIVTTNLENLGPGASRATSTNEYQRVMKQDTLGDRIGARMFSRLQQMCLPVEIKGPDWRAKG
jgi:DNA replication protein DnaC